MSSEEPRTKLDRIKSLEKRMDTLEKIVLKKEEPKKEEPKKEEPKKKDKD